jgi:hypothetical protein
LDHADLLEEIVEREIALEHAHGIFLGLFLVNDFLEVLHEPDDVTHAEHAARWEQRRQAHYEAAEAAANVGNVRRRVVRRVRAGAGGSRWRRRDARSAPRRP